jgi:hypothetical protein
VGNSEEFDKNSICIGNIDSAEPPENKIVVGMFTHFRISHYLYVFLYRQF